jgi:hypothetical protein
MLARGGAFAGDHRQLLEGLDAHAHRLPEGV